MRVLLGRDDNGWLNTASFCTAHKERADWTLTGNNFSYQNNCPSLIKQSFFFFFHFKGGKNKEYKMYKLAITTVYNAHKIHLHVTVRKYSITCLSLSKLADLNHLHTGAEQNTCKNVNILPSIVSYCHCDQTIATK